MKFWLLRGIDNEVYITQSDDIPVRVDNRCTGWNIGWPGTAAVNEYAQMFGLFGILYEHARDTLNYTIFPKSYDDNPVELELSLKLRWYES